MITYNKLVRDKIPAIIKNSGKKVNYRVLSKEEYKDQLKLKLVEEVNEFLAAQTEKEMIEELADIKEVLAAIYKAFKLVTVTEKVRCTKFLDKGGFSKRYFLESVEE